MSSIDQSNRVQIDFLRTELDISIAFADRALATNDPWARERNRLNARQGYDTFNAGLDRVTIEPSELEVMSQTAERLRTLLKELGEKL